jgi:hypothetical protein
MKGERKGKEMVKNKKKKIDNDEWTDEKKMMKMNGWKMIIRWGMDIYNVIIIETNERWW